MNILSRRAEINAPQTISEEKLSFPRRRESKDLQWGTKSAINYVHLLNADRDRYYQNLQMGLPVNFYDGRHDPDHTLWLLYFVGTMARAANELQAKAQSLYQELDPDAPPWENLPRPQQQILTRLLARVLDGIENPFLINPSDIASWFGVSENTAREWLRQWATEGFVKPVLAASRVRVRSYTLAEEWVETCFQIRQPNRGK